jgi:hypothetical protein
MSLRTAVLGVLAVAVAFGGAYALSSRSGEPAVARARPATVVALAAVPRVPFLAPGEPLPDLAKPRVRRHRHHEHDRTAPPAPPHQDPAPTATPAPVTPLPRPPAPHDKPRPSPPDDRSYDEPGYEPPPQVTPVPTAVPPADPGPEEEVPEDGTPE